MNRETFSLNASGNVFAHWFTVWDGNTYMRKEPFSECPCLGVAGSTAGAPVATGPDFLAGVRCCCDAHFDWDGHTLRVEAPTDAFFSQTMADEDERWSAYHSAVDWIPRSAPFGRLPEYCTWVEQKRYCEKILGVGGPMENTPPDLIFSYLDSVQRESWPTGRFTVDAGWSVLTGPGGFGDWEPRLGWDMKKIADAIRTAGHVPGLWFAPAFIHKESDVAQHQPELLGPQVEMGGECAWTQFHYLNPGPATQDLFNDFFQRAFDWGFRKFKLDVLYGPKPAMYRLSEQCRIAVDQLAEPTELEGHIPDPFCARHMDVVRLNDLHISAQHPRWKSVFDGHAHVCRYSTNGMLLNLDHVGGNGSEITEEAFGDHLTLMRPHFDVGYPCISMLPHHAGSRAVAAVTAMLHEYVQGGA